MTDTPEIEAARKARREAVAEAREALREANALFEAARAASDAARRRLCDLLAASKEPMP